MVLYKRKPVKFESQPPVLDDHTDIWVIEATGEVFKDYESYLTRRDFYMQKSFTCETTGHSGYTFFEALENESEASKEISSILPHSIQERALHLAQFTNTPRMDDLVNSIYDHFRQHYIPGDRVSIETEAGRRYGVVIDITNAHRMHHVFNSRPLDDQWRSNTYTIKLEGNGEEVTQDKASEIQRDRRIYSKLMLKQFLRSAVSRDAWNGAPWTVKDHLAKHFNIPTTIPETKTRDAIIAARKTQTSLYANNGPNPHHLPAILHPYITGNQPLPLGDGKTHFVHFAGNVIPFQQHEHGLSILPSPSDVRGPPIFRFPPPNPLPGDLYGNPNSVLSDLPLHHVQHNLPPHLIQMAHQILPPRSGFPIGLPFQNNFMQYQTLPPIEPPQAHFAPPAKTVEPVKYPIEDLKIKLRRADGIRPTLKFLSDDVPKGAEPPPKDKQTGLLMKSIGPLLCIWDTLNVHDAIYSLDSFTLDHFIGAMCFSSTTVECELLTEIHCAVLKQYISDAGKLQIQLPHVDGSESANSSSSENSPQPEPEPPMRTTRSSLRRSEANQIAKEALEPPAPLKHVHMAADFVSEFDWVKQCAERNFREGGWQAILVGLLYRLSFDTTHKNSCDEILAALLPKDDVPSVERIVQNYIDLNVNFRISALQLALRLTVTTEQFREQLNQASLEMTGFRKAKIDFQKRRKELADELFKLDVERKIQLPLNLPESTSQAEETPESTMVDVDEAKENAEDDDKTEEAQSSGRKARKAAMQMKRKRDSNIAKKENAKKAKAAAAKSKQQREWEKLLAALEKKKDELRECEANINELDDDLRETSVHRSKILGKDRFLNKYYWFEHNGMPFGGVPNSSTASCGYANGRLWVQGPDEWELQPNLEEPALSQDKEQFDWTVAERKDKEEGETHLASATEWGYYDDPEDVDNLLTWLDERGVRERALRKELHIFRDRIVEYMDKCATHLAQEANDKADETATTRVSTRNKIHAEKEMANAPCLSWTNSIMRDDLGYNHSEEYKPPKKLKKGVAKVMKTKGKK